MGSEMCIRDRGKAAPSEKPLAPDNLLVAVPFGNVKIVRRGNRSEEHRVQYNGIALDHRRGYTGRDPNAGR